MKIFIKRYVPTALINGLKMLLVKKRLFCPVCNSRVHRFNRLPDMYFEQWIRHRYARSIFNIETINLLSFSCPVCGSSDRDRFFALYLSEYLKNKDIRVLDIAPSKQLSGLIRSFKGVKYRTADRYMEDVDDGIDITNMNVYADSSFDFIICSHVLEHVKEDLKALREIYRVLAVGGRGIIMAPIHLDLENDQESDKDLSPEEKWHHHGQGDHIRTYSKKGFMNKLRGAGFTVEELTVNEFSPQLFHKCGISEGSVLYIVAKY